MMHDLLTFIQGLSTMGFVIAGLFFLRFWRQTRDRLFLLFALAFWIFAVNRTALLFVEETSELGSGLFVVRVSGFLLIIAAIIDKNRSSSSSSSSDAWPHDVEQQRGTDAFR